jgi:acidic leucine-rich nuclear phosphoprotein 32 family protein A/C/D
LSLNGTKLKSLANLPDWKGIVRLEAAENQITGGELSNIKKFSDTLVVLKLANNKIQSFDDIKTLSSFKSLKNLDLGENIVTSIEEYRKKVFGLLPQLEVLDGHDKEDNSVESSDIDDYGEEGEYDQNGFISDDDEDAQGHRD